MNDKLINGRKLIENLGLICQCWSVSPYVSSKKLEGAQDMLKQVIYEVDHLPDEREKMKRSHKDE